MDDHDITEAWIERAAIMEHDGKLLREDAEYKAARAIRSEYGRITDAIKAAINTTKGSSND